MKNTPLLFESKNIRRIWHENEWWFSIVDVVSVLVESDRGRKYWNDIKNNIVAEEYIQLSAKIGRLKLTSLDGKMRETDCANTGKDCRV